MQITFEVTLDYEEEPLPNEPSPTEEDIVKWILEGMKKEGFDHLNVSVDKQ